MRKSSFVLAAAAALCLGAPAQATITDYTFTGALAGSGSFSVYVDNTSITDPSNPPTIYLTAFSYTLGSTTFSLGNVDSASLNATQIAIGGSDSGVFGLTGSATDDFIFDFNACIFDGTPGNFHCIPQTQSQVQDITFRIGAFPNGTLNSDQITISLAGQDGGGDTGSLPEPATWAMMLLGFGAIGFVMRRRQRRVSDRTGNFSLP
jgi:PEP-CTERM motif